MHNFKPGIVVQRHRRWPSITSALGQCLIFSVATSQVFNAKAFHYSQNKCSPPPVQQFLNMVRHAALKRLYTFLKNAC